MDNTKIIVGGANVNGNVGSCEVKTTTTSVDSWHTASYAVNSCTGEVLLQKTYYDWGYLYIPLVIVIPICLIVAFGFWVSNRY
jgi:hypothetical protein